jgi:oligosaccharide repeat unit polymerase
VTTPLNNLNYNINTFDFVRFKPLAVVSSLVPSFLRGLLPADVAMEDFQLVNDNLNVSTMHPVFLYSFGYVGSIFFYFLMGVFMSFIYYKWIRERKLKWMFINVVLLHNILFSGFVNFFTHLVFVFQILLHYYLGTRIVIKSRKSS